LSQQTGAQACENSRERIRKLKAFTAFKRCMANLVSSAARFASTVAITGHRDHRWLTVTVDDDGPGIPP
jgi:signal transduction histidine kinase